MKKQLLPLTVCLFLFLLLLTTPAYARVGPKAYLNEFVTCDYDYDGSVLTAASRTGQVEVSVPNDDDVLQSVNVTLTGYNPNTTITAAIANRNVVTSYTAGGWGANPNNTQVIYVDTTAGSQQSSYKLNDTDAAPTINLSITWSNEKGGTDLYDSDNLYYTANNLTFNLTIKNPSDQKPLNNVNITIYFNMTSAAADALNVTKLVNALDGGGTSRGAMDKWDNDGDSDFETVSWFGNLENSGNQKVIYFRFYANITEATNFANGQDSHDLDYTYDKGAHANYTSSGSTLSGATISDKFSRGPIRQGVDLSYKGGYWHVRGLIRSMSNNSLTCSGCQELTYNLSEWRVYEVSPTSGAPMTPANLTGYFNQSSSASFFKADDGRLYTTNSTRSSNTSWYNASTSTKPYFSIYMDWEVVWDEDDNDIYTGYINTTLNLPTLYVIDLVHDKLPSEGYVSPDTGGENITFDDNVTFTGSYEAPAKEVEIYSIVPGETFAGLDHGDFNIFSGEEKLQLHLYNGSGNWRLNISSDQDAIIVTVLDPVAGTDGYVNMSTYDFSSIEFYNNPGVTIGRYMNDSSDKLWLTYVIESSGEMTTGDQYKFNGTVRMETDTGTPLLEAQDEEFINVSARRLIGWKELIAYDPTTPSVVNASILLEVQDGTGDGIPGIKFIDYVPNWTMNLSQYKGNVTVQLCDTGCTTWVLDTDYKITDNGTHTLPDGALVHAFEFINASAGGDTWNLTNGQFLNVTYQMDVVDSGLYILPTIISAFDPITRERFDTTAYGIIKVVVPEPSVSLQTTEGELELAKRVIVGKPVLWIKEFDVYNPNPRSVYSRFETLVFSDVMDGQVSYYNEQGDRVDLGVGFSDTEEGKVMFWEDRINAFETRAYEVRILTPPILEIDRDIEVLEKLDNKMVKLKMDVYLKNFAEEGYENIILNLPIAYQNIFEVKDAFGNQLAFTGGAETSSITIDSMEPGGLKTVTVVYKESYPTIIITPDRDRYDLNSPVGLEILVINGGDDVEYPYLEVEIYTPQMDVMFSTIEKLEDMEPLEKTEVYEKFVIPAYAPGGMYLASARFRENFVTLASATGNFLVIGGAGVGIPESIQVLIVIIVILILAYFSLKRVREVRRGRIVSPTGV